MSRVPLPRSSSALSVTLTGAGLEPAESTAASAPTSPHRDPIIEMAEALARYTPPASESDRDPAAGVATPMAALPAPLPINDFEDDFPEDGPVPIPSTWLQQQMAPRPSWLAVQAKAAGFGLLGGLVVIVPLVIVLSGQAGKLHASLLPGTGGGVAHTSPRTEPVIKPRIVVTSPVALPSQPAPEAPPAATAAPVAPSATVVEARVVETKPIEAPVIVAALVPAPVQVQVQPPPPAPTPPVDRAAELRRDAAALIASGDVLSGRWLLTQALADGDPNIALLLGETFDPNMLAAWGIRDVTPDVATARAHYDTALASGVEAARQRLKALE